MSRRVTIGILTLMLVAGVVSVAWASDSTEASAAMAPVSNTTAAWASGLLIFGFVSGIVMLLLSPRTDVNLKALLAIPIFCIMIGALLKAGPLLLSPFSALGATLR